MDEFTGDRSATPPLPILPDDLLLEILQRLPQEPIYLFLSSLVSKHWRGLVHNAGFLRRFRDFHGGTPPVLGFFNNQPGPPLFVPTAAAFAASTIATLSHHDWWAFDCRHGYALLGNRHSSALLILDMVTGDERYLPSPPTPPDGGLCNVAVLRAAGDGGCHSRCPFLVVYVCSPSNYVVCACVYSSETGVWTDFTSIDTESYSVDAKPTALVGNTLYWLLDNSCIFEFDLDNHSLGLTERIPYDDLCRYGEILLMPTEVGLLGLAGVEGFSLHLWSMVKNIDGVVTWTRQRVIDLEKFIKPEVLAMCTVRVEPIGFAEDADVIFIDVEDTVYMIHLKSIQIKEASEKGTYGSIFPYAHFYSPGITVHGGDDQAEPL